MVKDVTKYPPPRAPTTSHRQQGQLCFTLDIKLKTTIKKSPLKLPL